MQFSYQWGAINIILLWAKPIKLKSQLIYAEKELYWVLKLDLHQDLRERAQGLTMHSSKNPTCSSAGGSQEPIEKEGCKTQVTKSSPSQRPGRVLIPVGN